MLKKILKFFTKNRGTNVRRAIAAMLVLFLQVQILEVPIVKAAPAFFGQTVAADSVQAQADAGSKTTAQNHWGVVAILVEQSLLEDSTNYEGLTANATYADKLKT